MSNKDINNNPNEYQKKISHENLTKSKIQLFSYSHLKSKTELTLSHFNYFNFNFNKKKNPDLEENKKKIEY